MQSLRLLAIFGALGTSVTLLRLATGVSVPLLPLALLAPFVAQRRRRVRAPVQDFASVVVGLMAAGVELVERVAAPGPLLDAHVPWIAIGVVLTGFIVGGLTRIGAHLADAAATADRRWYQRVIHVHWRGVRPRAPRRSHRPRPAG